MTQAVWCEVDHYIVRELGCDDDVLAAALAASDAAGLPQIAVAPNQGKLLHLLALVNGARNILEVGTLGGYSAIWLARALPAGGKLTTLELDPKHAEVARGNLARAGVSDRVDVRVGPALTTLETLASERGRAPFDFSFIDADKANNPGYFEWALKMSRPGALIVVDNVVRHGAIVDAEAATRDAAVAGVRKLYERVGREPRVSATAIQTVGTKGHDGLLIARVNA